MPGESIRRGSFLTNRYNSRFSQLFERAERETRPISAMIEVTHRCHLACVHCYLEDNHQWHDRDRELSTTELTSIIDQLKDAGCFFLTITGGEIFLRPDILDIVRHARRHGLAVTLFTTGTLLTEEKIDELADLYPMGVELSLYSVDASVHDGITKKPGSHSKTMWALHSLRSKGVRVLIKCPLMQQNINSYQGLKDLAHRLGISLLVDVTVTSMNNDDLSPTQYRLTTDQVAAAYQEPDLKPFAKVNQRVPHPTDSICAIGKRSCLIGPFGDIYTCMGFKRTIGNLREQSFHDIWFHSSLLNKVRSISARDLPVCSTCEKFSYCNRCSGAALSEDGDFLGPSSWACHIAAAKEKAAGLPVRPSAAERLGLVSVIAEGDKFRLQLVNPPQGPPASKGLAQASSSLGGCGACVHHEGPEERLIPSADLILRK